MAKRKTKSKQNTVRKNISGNWRGIEDRFFNKVRKGFKRILGKTY